MDTSLNCPKCGEPIEISEALKKSLAPELEKEILAKAQKNFQEESQKMLAELEFKNKKLEEARQESLKLHQEKLKLEDEKQSFEIEKQRQLQKIKDQAREQALLEAGETHRQKDLEKDKKLSDALKQIEELKIKMQQGSQQTQGEVAELDLEENLKRNFPSDLIEPVGKGVRGADVVQTVRTSMGTVCGIILWESKHTKSWVDDWTTKLKDDLRSSQANIPVILSNVLPKNITGSFGRYEGVWVAEHKVALSVAEILRQSLIDIARERYNNKDRGTKADLVYGYLTSDNFIQHIQNIVEVHQNLIDQIATERRALEKIWKEREAQAQRMITSTASIYGSIQGLAGSSLPNLPSLSLPE